MKESAINVTPATLINLRRTLDDAASRMFVIQDTSGRDSGAFQDALREYNRILSQYDCEKKAFNESLRIPRAERITLLR